MGAKSSETIDRGKHARTKPSVPSDRLGEWRRRPRRPLWGAPTGPVMLVVIPGIGGLIAFIGSAVDGDTLRAVVSALVAAPAIAFGVLYLARPVAAPKD